MQQLVVRPARQFPGLHLRSLQRNRDDTPILLAEQIRNLDEVRYEPCFDKDQKTIVFSPTTCLSREIVHIRKARCLWSITSRSLYTTTQQWLPTTHPMTSQGSNDRWREPGVGLIKWKMGDASLPWFQLIALSMRSITDCRSAWSADFQNPSARA